MGINVHFMPSKGITYRIFPYLCIIVLTNIYFLLI